MKGFVFFSSVFKGKKDTTYYCSPNAIQLLPLFSMLSRLFFGSYAMDFFFLLYLRGKKNPIQFIFIMSFSVWQRKLLHFLMCHLTLVNPRSLFCEIVLITFWIILFLCSANSLFPKHSWCVVLNQNIFNKWTVIWDQSIMNSTISW